MTRRSALAILAVSCLWLPACQKVDPRVNKANYDKIQPEMARADVDALLGDKFDENPDLAMFEGSGVAAAIGVVGGLDQVGSGTPALRWVKWGGDKKFIAVCFNRNGRVHSNGFKTSKGLQ